MRSPLSLKKKLETRVVRLHRTPFGIAYPYRADGSKFSINREQCRWLKRQGRKRMISVLTVVNFRYLPLSAFFRISSMAAGVIIRVDLCRSKQRSPLSPVTRNSA